jgi:hypothetical protein
MHAGQTHNAADQLMHTVALPVCFKLAGDPMKKDMSVTIQALYRYALGRLDVNWLSRG